jgi:hypothetical protein
MLFCLGNNDKKKSVHFGTDAVFSQMFSIKGQLNSHVGLMDIKDGMFWQVAEDRLSKSCP